jgi:ankyrin repeat protein
LIIYFLIITPESQMCTPLANNIITFNVSGTSVKIPVENLALYPESSLATMVHNKVQPSDGFFVECCPKIFGYILRFILHKMKLDPGAIAVKLITSEILIREVIDGFKFKEIYVANISDIIEDDSSKDFKKQEATELYKNIWTLAEQGELEKLKLIVDYGFDLEARCPRYWSTALMYASQNGHLDCVKFLVEHGAKVNASNASGLTSLHFSTTGDIVDYLIQHGADICAVSSRNTTPLHYAFLPNNSVATKHRSSMDYKQVVRRLLFHKARLNMQNDFGQTPLHLAIIHSTNDFVNEILENYKDCIEYNIQTNEGNNLLHQASIKSLPIVRQLLKIVASSVVNATNKAGDTPLIFAAKYAQHEIVAELCSHMVLQKS